MSDSSILSATGPFPQHLLEILKNIGRVAQSEGMHAYLVGGAVRDSLLGRSIVDLDICVEGDALELAEKLKSTSGAVILMKSQFLTTRIELADTIIDIATCRDESYGKPGLLPTVHPSSLEHDLARRDFTINSMALDITPMGWGKLIDPFSGKTDLDECIIRSLHEDSFPDDPTRIFRAIRYSQRLEFSIAAPTMHDISKNTYHIDDLSSDRIIAELEKIYAETKVNDILSFAYAWGILGRIHPSLEWTDSHVAAMNRSLGQEVPVEDAFLAITGYLLKGTDLIDALLERIANSGRSKNLILQAASIRSIENQLVDPALRPSAIHSQLKKHDPHIIVATRALTSNIRLAEILGRELNEFRHAETSITATDLLEMGVPEGPAIGAILEVLETNALDYPETTQDGQVTLVKEWLQNYHTQD